MYKLIFVEDCFKRFHFKITFWAPDLKAYAHIREVSDQLWAKILADLQLGNLKLTLNWFKLRMFTQDCSNQNIFKQTQEFHFRSVALEVRQANNYS